MSSPAKKKRKDEEEKASLLLSLPDDLVFNCIARVSRLYHPTLSRVSKRFRSLVASPELYKDLPRTFPGHPWLDTPEAHAALRRVLVDYSFRDSDVGYCQTEEDAFWMLAVLLENVLVRDCYTTNLSGCHVEQRIFKDLLAQKCPRQLYVDYRNVNQQCFRVAFERIGSMTTNTISKQRKKQERSVMAEVDQRLGRLTSLKESGKDT